MAHEFEKATEKNPDNQEARNLFLNICEKANNIAITAENDVTNNIAENPLNNLRIFNRYLDSRQIEQSA